MRFQGPTGYSDLSRGRVEVSSPVILAKPVEMYDNAPLANNPTVERPLERIGKKINKFLTRGPSNASSVVQINVDPPVHPIPAPSSSRLKPISPQRDTYMHIEHRLPPEPLQPPGTARTGSSQHTTQHRFSP